MPNTLENLSKKELIDKVNELQKLVDQKEANIYEFIDNFIDNWFEKNKENVDIGVIDIGGVFKVDVLPDSIEKHIYKKVFKIMFSMLHSLPKE